MVKLIGLVNCSSCQAKIGRLIEENGEILIDDGVFSVLVGRRFCNCCRLPFHWDGRKYTIEKAISEFGRNTKKDNVGA
jgi:hypothetical protein